MKTNPATSIRITRMQSHQAGTVSALFRDVVLSLPYYDEIAKRSELAKYTADNLCEFVKEDPDSVLVAEFENELAGFCFSRIDDGLVWASWFGVHAAHRQQGIGSALLKELEESVRQGRSHKIWCDCRTDNKASKSVLKRHNYTPLCVVRNHWYGQDFILWEKLVR